MLVSSSILGAFCVLRASVYAAASEQQLELKPFFLKQDEPVAEAKRPFSFFDMGGDLRYFDFYGNQISWRPDRTLPADSAVCLQTENNNINFRKFLGLISPENDEAAFSDFLWLTNWLFDRVNQLKSSYYYPDRTDRTDDADFDISSPQDQKVFFPRLVTSEGQSAVLNDFLIDLFRVILPNLKGSQLDGTIDIAGIGMFLALKFTNDLEGYFDEVKELYAILKDLANGPFDLKLLEKTSNFDEINRQELLEELFRVALETDLLYTLELFYALEAVELDGELLKFVLERSNCPAVLNRFFDFMDWKGLMHVPEMWISTPVSRLHYMFAYYPEYLEMFYEYEPMRVDWSIAEIPSGEESITILGKLLLPLTENNSIFEDGKGDNHSRFLLRELLKDVEVPRLLSRNPDRDLLDECLENKLNGFKLLSEYFDALPGDQVDGVVTEYLSKIVEIWRAGDELSHVKIFKFLMKKKTGTGSIDVLCDAYELISSWTPQPAKSPKMSSRSSSSSGRRSLSGEFIRSLFRDPSTGSLLASPSRSPDNCGKTSTAVNVAMMKLIAEEGEACSVCDPELRLVWTNRLADLENY